MAVLLRETGHGIRRRRPLLWLLQFKGCKIVLLEREYVVNKVEEHVAFAAGKFNVGDIFCISSLKSVTFRLMNGKQQKREFSDIFFLVGDSKPKCQAVIITINQLTPKHKKLSDII